MQWNGDEEIWFRIVLSPGKMGHHLRQGGSVIESLLVFVLVNQIDKGFSIMKRDDGPAINWAMLLALSTDTLESRLIGTDIAELDFPGE